MEERNNSDKNILAKIAAISFVLVVLLPTLLISLKQWNMERVEKNRRELVQQQTAKGQQLLVKEQTG